MDLQHKIQEYTQLQDSLLNGFADQYSTTHTLAEAGQLADGTGSVALAGRIVKQRTMGKLIFASLFDFGGSFQVCVQIQYDEAGFQLWKNSLGLGDFVGVTGEIFTTQKGEKSLRVHSFHILQKAIRPLPDKFHGLENVETRYRQRYLDIISNEDTRNVIHIRHKIIQFFRNHLIENRYIEVETPILQTVASGAIAKPFQTHHNALGMDCVLRISCETYLKRCIGAGMERVFEFARSFRNEGISAVHLQDFTMLEFYASYWNAETMLPFVANMMRQLVSHVFQTDTVVLGTNTINFAGEWPVFDYCELVEKYSGISILTHSTKESLIQSIDNANIVLDTEDKNWRQFSWANIVDVLYKKMCRPSLIQPCFLVKYPVDMAPLARRNKDNPAFVDFFQFLVNGTEIIKAYSELVDPLDQRQRFVEQSQAKATGDEEAMSLDEDFLVAMEHGFPPIAGVGIGIDRLTMILSGASNIKDTVLFPLLKPVL
jgi:lysyl-tRNA synthetase, class II